MLGIGINGFGRTGRAITRIFFSNRELYKEINIVGINSHADPQTAAHLLQYDSVHRKFTREVNAADGSIIVHGEKTEKIPYYSFGNPREIPWSSCGATVVIDSTGEHVERKRLVQHLENDVKKVICSAPCEDSDITIVYGINHQSYNPSSHNIISGGSCTTGAIAPPIKVIKEKFGIIKGGFGTTHAYTMDQRLLDNSHCDLARARAAQEVIAFTKTGAQKVITKLFPELKNKFEGYALRVPVPDGSLAELTLLLKKGTTNDEMNSVLKEASDNSLKGILGYSEENLTQVDYIGRTESGIVHAIGTKIIDDNLAQVFTWYDNEIGYAARLLDLVKFLDKVGI